jgi:hypothetical protein
VKKEGVGLWLLTGDRDELDEVVPQQHGSMAVLVEDEQSRGSAAASMESGYGLEGEDGAVDAERGRCAWSPQRCRGYHAAAGVVTAASTWPRARATSGWRSVLRGCATRMVGARTVGEARRGRLDAEGGSSCPEAGGATRSSVGVAADVVAARRRG